MGKSKSPIFSKETILLDLEAYYHQCSRNFTEISNVNRDYLKDVSICTPNTVSKLRTRLMKYSDKLHNYLDSFYGFDNYVNYIIKNEVGNSIKETISQRRELFIKNEVNAFVISLRGVARHVKLPVVAAGADVLFTSKALKTNAAPCVFLYDLPSLKFESFEPYTKQWNESSKKFLEWQFKEPKRREIEIMPFVVASFRNIDEFYKDIHKEIESW